METSLAQSDPVRGTAFGRANLGSEEVARWSVVHELRYHLLGSMGRALISLPLAVKRCTETPV